MDRLIYYRPTPPGARGSPNPGPPRPASGRSPGRSRRPRGRRPAEPATARQATTSARQATGGADRRAALTDVRAAGGQPGGLSSASCRRKPVRAPSIAANRAARRSTRRPRLNWPSCNRSRRTRSPSARSRATSSRSRRTSPATAATSPRSIVSPAVCVPPAETRARAKSMVSCTAVTRSCTAGPAACGAGTGPDDGTGGAADAGPARPAARRPAERATGEAELIIGHRQTLRTAARSFGNHRRQCRPCMNAGRRCRIQS